MWFATQDFNLPQGGGIQSINTTQLQPLGTIITAYDPIQGFGEFIYLAGVASTVVGDLVSYNPFTGVTTRGAATAGSGLPLAVAMSPCVATFYGWYQISGTMVVNNNATAVAGIAYQKATAQIGSAQVAGTQVLGGGTILVANSSTFTKTVTTKNGATQLFVPNFDGLYVGLPVSGTGIAGGSVIAAGVDSSPNASNTSSGSSGFVVLNNAMTADGTVTGTFTRTNQSLMSGNRIFAQGQIL